jgi:hypothetical protein
MKMTFEFSKYQQSFSPAIICEKASLGMSIGALSKKISSRGSQ